VVASTTTNRDFKVKHGLDVAQGATFGGTVTVATPTQNAHAATKLYVDSKPISFEVLASAPASPINGQMYFDTVMKRLHVFYNSEWAAIANIQDAEFLQDHIHDTSIGGNGMLTSIFVEAGTYNEPGAFIETGVYNSVLWSETWDGGISMDNFA
jgi:hypothetical protein